MIVVIDPRTFRVLFPSERLFGCWYVVIVIIIIVSINIIYQAVRPAHLLYR